MLNLHDTIKKYGGQLFSDQTFNYLYYSHHINLGMKNRVSFNYNLAENGRAKALLVVGDELWSFEVSNQGDPLKELLDNMCAMILTPSHLWEEQNLFATDWFCDLIGVRWTLSTADGEWLYVKLEVFDDIFDADSGNVIFETECGYIEFFNAIIKELDRFIKKVGLLNYKQKWHNQGFPISSFLFLKKMLIERGVWKPNGKASKAFTDELDLLLS